MSLHTTSMCVLSVIYPVYSVTSPSVLWISSVYIGTIVNQLNKLFLFYLSQGISFITLVFFLVLLYIKLKKGVRFLLVKNILFTNKVLVLVFLYGNYQKQHDI